MLIQWFPGHMAKTKKLIQEHLKAVDVAAELLDARIPSSSANPMVEKLLSGKPHVIILNKADLADPVRTEEWIQYYRKKGFPAIPMTAGNKKDKKRLLAVIQEAARPMQEKWKRRGLRPRPARLIVLGIPNVGKSTLINFLSGRAAARTANTPGHTRGKQWVRLSNGIDLLDTPGILWPKFDDQKAAMKLAMTGAIAGDVFSADEVVPELLQILSRRAPQALIKKYGIKDVHADPDVLLEAAGRRRGCLLPGGTIDYDRAEAAVLSDFRSGKLGRITLDAVPAEAS